VRGRRCRSRAADAVPEHQQLNPLQSKAAPVVLDTDRHLLVVAPTGAGETVIGQIRSCARSSSRGAAPPGSYRPVSWPVSGAGSARSGRT